MIANYFKILGLKAQANGQLVAYKTMMKMARESALEADKYYRPELKEINDRVAMERLKQARMHLRSYHSYQMEIDALESQDQSEINKS